MVVKLGQNLPEMIMRVADVAREKQHGRCSNNARQSNHSIKTFSQVLFFFFFVFKEQRQALISYLSFPTVCGRGPINIAPKQLLPSPLMYMHGTQHNQCPGLVGLDALSQSPISNLHACKIQATRFHRCYNYLKVALHCMEDRTQQSDWLIRDDFLLR